MRSHLRLFLICWLSTIMLLGGCAPQRPTARYRIVVIPKGMTHEHWKAVHAGAKKAAEEHGEVEIIWQGPSREDNRQEQQDIVQQFTAERVDAIVLAPTDRETLVAPVKAALKEGIPVVIIDSGLEETPEIDKHEKYLGYVATDNYKGGEKAAERMGELLKGNKSAKVLMLPYQAGSESTEQREKGFQDRIKEFDNIELIVARDEAGATVDTAQKAADRVLLVHEDIDAIFTPNESSTVGMLQALRSRKQAGKITFVGFDGSPTLIAALKGGEIQGLVLQDPFDMGYQSVRRAILFLDGIPPDNPVHYTSSHVATPENVDTPEIRRMYAPVAEAE